MPLLRKTQERELELLRAGSLPQLFERLIHGLRRSYQLDVVTLTLDDPKHEMRHLLCGRRLDAARAARMSSSSTRSSPLAPQLASLERPWLGPSTAPITSCSCRGLPSAAASR